MRYLRPKTAPSAAPRDQYLFETKNAGMGARGGPRRDLFQERAPLAGIAGTGYEPYQRDQHHRSQLCVYVDGNALVETSKPGIGGRPLYYR